MPLAPSYGVLRLQLLHSIQARDSQALASESRKQDPHGQVDAPFSRPHLRRTGANRGMKGFSLRSGEVRLVLTVLLALSACSVLFAGGGRHNVLIVVNDSSAVSKAIGEYYRAARNIPPANVCHINCTTSESISSADFVNSILYPIENYLTAHGLVEQIQYIVLTKGVPLQVSTTGNSVDSGLSLAFQRWPDGTSPCIEGAGSSYVAEERDFGAFRASSANTVVWSNARPLRVWARVRMPGPLQGMPVARNCSCAKMA